MILLDTCTFLWLCSGDPKLSKKSQKTISENRGEIFLSVITGFELGIKFKKKLLDLPDKNLLEWIGIMCEHHGIQEIPISRKIAINSTQLPLIHQDPADRLIIATAMENNLTILTPDKHIKAYKGVKVKW